MDPARIALIKPSALGDIVHSLPVLGALRRRFPQSQITWVVNKSYESLLAGHPDLTDTLAFDRGAFKKGLWNSTRYAVSFAAELRRRRFDLVIDLQGLLRTGLMCLATGAKRIVGFSNAREGSRYAYTQKVRVPDADRIHAVERYWRVAQAVVGQGSSLSGQAGSLSYVPIQSAALDWADTELAALPRPWIAFAVGSRWATKRWPTTHFAELARLAQSHFGGSCLFVGVADDTVLSLDTMRTLSGPARDFTGKTTLPQLAALLSRCDAMVANDTGPLHLAAALGRPCVAPYTCTKVALHGPFGFMSGGVETSVPCRGSYLKTCDKMICMPDLTPDRLWGRLAEVLETCQRNRRSA
jgi:lipopolysaccharide heptosyltransferase I